MEIREFLQDEWHTIVSQFDDLSMMQLWEYGEAKRKLQGWHVVRYVFRDGDTIVGAAQSVVKMIPFLKKGIVWISRGPLWQKKGTVADYCVLQDILDILKRHWVDQEKMYLRIAPPLMHTEENVKRMHTVGFRSVPSSQWISERVNLTKSEEELRVQLRRYWRRDLKKAEESGITCVVKTSEKALAEFTEDYRTFLKRKHFSTNITPEFIQTFQNLLPPERKMPILLAYKGEERLASIFIAIYGKVAEGIAEGIHENTLHTNVGKILFWSTMIEMKKRGFTFFDVGGANPHITEPGILQFKAGIRGVQYSLVGEFDLARGVIPRLIRLILKYRS